MINNEHKKFINMIDNVDKTNIVLKFKLGDYFKRELILFGKNNMLLIFALFVILIKIHLYTCKIVKFLE